MAREWFANRPYTGLPVNVPHISSSQRLVMVHDEGGEMKVLFSKEEGGTTRLPACLIHRDTLFSRVDHMTTLDSAVKVSECIINCQVKLAVSRNLLREKFMGFVVICTKLLFPIP